MLFVFSGAGGSYNAEEDRQLDRIKEQLRSSAVSDTDKIFDTIVQNLVRECIPLDCFQFFSEKVKYFLANVKP